MNELIRFRLTPSGQSWLAMMSKSDHRVGMWDAGNGHAVMQDALCMQMHMRAPLRWEQFAQDGSAALYPSYAYTW